MQVYSPRSYYLVLGQVSSFLALCLSYPRFPQNPTAGFFVWLGITLGLWSVWTMNRSGRLHFLPDVRPGGRLVTSGPYRLVRHPIYSSVILFATGLFVDRPDFFRFIIYCILVAVHLLKLNYEEKILARAFPEYTAYRKGTWHLFPGLY